MSLDALNFALCSSLTRTLRAEQKHQAIHLADELGLEVEVVEKALNSYPGSAQQVAKKNVPRPQARPPPAPEGPAETAGSDDEEPEAKPAGKPPGAKRAATPAQKPTKTAAKTSNGAARPKKAAKGPEPEEPEAVHKCEWVGKPGTAPCTKTGKSDGRGGWFCGTERSGHLKSALSRAAKTAPKKAAGAAAKKKPGMSGALLAKLVRNHATIELVPAGGHKIHAETRIVFENQKAVGVLGPDNTTVSKLGETEIRFCEVHSLGVLAGDPDDGSGSEDVEKEDEEGLVLDSESEEDEADVVLD